MQRQGISMFSRTRDKGNGYTFQGGNYVRMFFASLPSEKLSNLQGKTLLQKGADSFLVESIPFQKGLGAQEVNRKSRI